jgi:hypothetical protein
LFSNALRAVPAGPKEVMYQIAEATTARLANANPPYTASRRWRED